MASEDKGCCKSKNSFNHSLIAFNYDKSEVLFEKRKAKSENKIFLNYSSSSSYLKKLSFGIYPIHVLSLSE